MNPTLFIFYVFAAPFILFADVTAVATSVGSGAYDVDRTSSVTSQVEEKRQFNEEDYVSLMTNYENDQRYLRGRKLQDIDYQKKPYYQSQQPAYGASRAQVVILAVVITLTAGLAVYAAVLYREAAAVTLYNVLGYRLFGDSDIQGDSGEHEGVEIS